MAAAEAAAAAAIAANINQRMEFERQLALMSERMGQFEKSAREAANEAFEKGRAVAMEERSTVAETAACSSNGLAARLDAYVIHTPPQLSEKILASNVPIVPQFPMSGNLNMPTVTLVQPAEIVAHNGSDGTAFGTPEGQIEDVATGSGGLPGCPSNGLLGGTTPAPIQMMAPSPLVNVQLGAAHSQGGQPQGVPGNGPPGGGPPSQGGQPIHPGKNSAYQPNQSPQPSQPDGNGGGGGGGGGGGDGPDKGPDDSDSSSGSQKSRATTLEGIDRELRKIHKKKYKEADHIKFPNWPSAPGFRAYKNIVYQKINTASGRPDDKAMCWAREAENDELPDSHFHVVPKRFATLSRKIASAVQENAHGELGRNITETVEDWIRENKSVPGLLLLRMVFKYYSTGRPAEAMFNLNDLQQVKMINNNLEQYMNTLTLVLKGMKHKPDLETQEFLFFENIRKHPKLSEDIAHYRRLPEGSGGDRSLRFLEDSVKRCLQTEREEKMRVSLGKAIAYGAGALNALPGTKGSKGDSKGDSKDKLCKFHAAGYCREGKSCKFSHRGKSQERGRSAEKGKKGDGKGKKGRDPSRSQSLESKGSQGQTPKKKNGDKACKFWLATGSCKLGDKCTFSHAKKVCAAAKKAAAKPKAGTESQA